MANTGHHHLLIDLNILPDKNLPIPSDEKHRHFGAGQTETSINLTPGTHTLQLMLGDHYHMQYKKSETENRLWGCMHNILKTNLYLFVLKFYFHFILPSATYVLLFRIFFFKLLPPPPLSSLLRSRR